MEFVLPVILALLGGGLIGSVLTSVITVRSTKQKRDDEAASALWAYQGVVRGYSNRLYQKAGYGDEMAIPGQASLSDVSEAQAVALRFSGFLPEEERSLVRQPQFDFGDAYGDDLAGADSSSKVADRLEKVLDETFSRKARRPILSSVSIPAVEKD